MNDSHYELIRKKYENNAQFLFTDTDSLCYEIDTEVFYNYMCDNKKLFDLSDMPVKFKDTTNKKIIGKFKN